MAVSVTDGALTIAAEEEVALALLHLRESIAHSSCWQAIVADPLAVWSDIKAAADAIDDDDLLADARDAIYLERVSGNPSKDSAIITIRALDDFDIENMGTAVWDVNGMFKLWMDLPIPEAYRDSVNVATVDFWNKASRIKREILNQSGIAERLFVETVRHGPAGQHNPDDFPDTFVRFADFTVLYQGATS